MKPYFQTHSAGWLFLILVIAFFGMESIQFFRQRSWRKNATRIATPAFWVGVVVWTVVATVMLHRGARIAPSARMGDGLAVFAIGMLLFAAGVALRWASFWALGQYFTFTVDVSPDQQVVTRGPYRVLRHPRYTGGLLAMAGIGVIYANWLGFAGFVVPCLIIIVWRIRIEEAALLRTAGEPYRTYAAHHKRLVPLIWWRSVTRPARPPQIHQMALASTASKRGPAHLRSLCVRESTVAERAHLTAFARAATHQARLLRR